MGEEKVQKDALYSVCLVALIPLTTLDDIRDDTETFEVHSQAFHVLQDVVSVQ